MALRDRADERPAGKQVQYALTRGALLFVVVALAACRDGGAPVTTPLSTTVGRALSHSDSIEAGYFQPRSSTTATADETCTSDCPVLIGADPPSMFQGYTQPNPVRLYFSGPAGRVTVVGSGAIQCSSGQYGTLVGYDASGVEIGRTDLQLTNPADCSPPENPDDVTFGAQATLETSVPMATAEILPMSPLEFLVLGNCCGHASATYTVTVEKGHLGDINLVCSGRELRGEVVICTATPKDPSQTLVVTGWIFESTDGVVVDRDPSTASNPTWQGQLVKNGQVTVMGTLDGNPAQSAPVSVSVTQRNWLGISIVEKDHMILNPDSLPDRPTAFYGQLGLTTLALPYNPQKVTEFSVLVSDGGPNDGLQYLTGIPVKTETRPMINNTALAVNSDFWLIQEKIQKTKGGHTYCGRDFVTGIIPLVEAHEGYNPAAQPNSHAGIYQQDVDLSAYIEFERAAGPPDSQIFENTRKKVHTDASLDSQLMDYDERNNITNITVPCEFKYDYSHIPKD